MGPTTSGQSGIDPGQDKLQDKLQIKIEAYKSFGVVDSDDDAPDHGLSSSMKKFHSRNSRPIEQDSRLRNTGTVGRDETDSATAPKFIPRSASDSTLTRRSGPSLLRTTSAVSATNRGMPPLKSRHTVTGPLPPAPAIPRTLGKRKRASTIGLAPEKHRVFNGLQFFFFPNTDTHLARRLRILKAIEFGASWQRDWNDFVTHVIVDKAIDYAALMKFLILQTLPASVVLVNETWPSECLAFKALLDHTGAQFRVTGAPAHTVTTKPTAQPPIKATRPSLSGSGASLSLKPAGKSVITRQSDTPSSSSNDRPLHESKRARPELANVAPAQQRHLAEETNTKSVSNTESNADFEAAISKAKELQGAPLDSEELEGRPGSSGGLPSGDESSTKPFQSDRPSSKSKSIQDRFQCMQSHTGKSTGGPNAETIQILQQMADYFGQIGDAWRTTAYRKAMATLRNHPQKISTREEAVALPNVGERLALKIEEIAYTHQLRRLESTHTDPRDHIIQKFTKVYGAGFAQANKWVQQGFTDLGQLLDKAKLSAQQRIGIEHYEDFNTRIPRAEVEQHGGIVREGMLNIDPAFEVTIGGSYRRGAATSGDIDCIITRPDASAAHICTAVLDRLVPLLISQGFLVAELAVTSRDDGSKWHGASRLPGTTVWRRIDFLLVPGEEIGAAMIYFTGNDIFNRSLRLLSSYKGMRLNQRGLYGEVLRGPGRRKVTEGVLLEGRSERRIFEILGVPWREPWERVV